VQLIYPFNLSPASSLTQANQVFRVNGLYDPDVTGTGSQPAYFDQWSALYKRYRVLGCWIDARFSNVDGQHIQVAMAPSSAASPLSTLSSVDVGAMRNSSIAEAHSGGPLGVLKAYLSVAKTWGVRDEVVLNDDDFASLTSTTPTNQVYLGLALATSGNSDTSWLAGRLIFDVRFESPVILSLSLSRLAHAQVTHTDDGNRSCTAKPPQHPTARLSSAPEAMRSGEGFGEVGSSALCGVRVCDAVGSFRPRCAGCSACAAEVPQ
jgi:hypothetical protein